MLTLRLRQPQDDEFGGTALDCEGDVLASVEKIGHGRPDGATGQIDETDLGGDTVAGPLLTKTLLISALSAGGSDGGPRLVARDKTTGEELGSVDLPAGAIGTPMTYMLGGTQHIALTVGGSPPELIAFSLPDR